MPWQYCQLPQKKTGGYEQSAELSNFVKFKWNLRKEYGIIQTYVILTVTFREVA